MELNVLAEKLADSLAYHLPALLHSTGGAAVATKGWTWMQGVWKRLGPKILDRPAAHEAAKEAAADPKDADALAALRLQLRKILQEDVGLAHDMTQLLAKAPAGVVASGERSVATGGSANKAVITTGDNNYIDNSRSMFDQRGQHVGGNQTNAGRDAYLAGRDLRSMGHDNTSPAQMIEQLKSHLEAAAKEGLEPEHAIDADAALKKAELEMKKPQPNKKTLLGYLSKIKDMALAGTATVAAVTGLSHAVEQTIDVVERHLK